MAITQLAVYDAVNAIERRNAPYLPQHPAPRAASPDAAAAAAAHTAMLSLFPSQQPGLDAKFQDSLSQLGDDAHVRQGIRVGTDAAHAVLAARANDGSDATPPPFTPQPGPGEYQLTPPNFPGAGLHALGQRPAVRARARRPVPPTAAAARDQPALHRGLQRSQGAGREHKHDAEPGPDGHRPLLGRRPVQNVWNQIAQIAGTENHNSVADDARMFALVDTSMADGVIALYDAKYTHHRWRPITAIQTADNDGNAGTAGDPNWTPLAVTALDPSYPGAHAAISEAAATALRAFFGTDRLDFALATPSLPGVTRTFQGFSQAADEASVSRIYAGQHFRSDEDAGQALGAAVGGFVADHILGVGRP
jgi:PAP2 superfamily